MDNLSSKLDQILNDPGSIKQIMNTMSALGLEPISVEQPTTSQELSDHLSMILQQTQEKEQKQQALIRALIPYLNPGKQKRLERAMQVAKLSNWAAYAFKDQFSSLSKEETHV